MLKRAWPLLLIVTSCEDPAPVPTPAAATTRPPQPSAQASSSTAGVTTGVTTGSALAAAPARPLYYEHEISDADLADRTLRELSLLRNTIYARVGNSFRRPWLAKHFAAQAWYQPKDAMDLSKLSAVDKTNARKIADHDAAITRKELERRRDEVLARRKRGEARAEDEVELSLLSQRLGSWLGDDSHQPTPLEDPTRLDRIITLEQLSTLSRRDLRILRNTIYARRGRAFESKVVRGYFEGARWYKPREDYHDGMLNGVDQRNIAIVRSVEDSLGGPEHENPDYGKDWWFVAA